MASNQSYLLDLLEQLEPIIRAAFLKAIYDLRIHVDLGKLIERLEKRDIEGAVEALHLDPAAFRALDRSLSEAYEGGGTAAIDRLPILRDPFGARFVIRFDMRNRSAESYLSSHSATLVQQIVDDQKTAVRAALTAGMEKGNGPRTVALDVAGRINKATGKREGGIIGLTSSQEEWVRAYEAQLSDPKRMHEALTRNMRDKRFDRTVAKAIREEKPIPAEIRAKMVTAYKNRALRYRAEMIARTEGITAMHASADEAYRQAIASGKVDAEAITRTWHTAGDDRVRDTHAAMNGQKVGFFADFVSPSGARLRYPGDPNAPAAERVACRCWCEVKIDFLRGVT